MRRSILGFLIAVLLLDTAGAVLLLTGAASPVLAVQEEPTGTEEEPPAPTADALLLLGRQLAERSEQLRLREVELEELLRSAEVERRLAELQSNEPAAAETAASPEPVQESPDSFAFRKLQRAYENMEPESAAVALAELASIDEEAVLQLLTGWSPRTSGAILDALTQTHPRLAAVLSYEIWKRGGKPVPPAASNGR